MCRVSASRETSRGLLLPGVALPAVEMSDGDVSGGPGTSTDGVASPCSTGMSSSVNNVDPVFVPAGMRVSHETDSDEQVEAWRVGGRSCRTGVDGLIVWPSASRTTNSTRMISHHIEVEGGREGALRAALELL